MSRMDHTRAEWLTPDEVAALLKMQPKTVRDHLRSGVWPGYKIGRRWRMRRDDLNAWVTAHSAPHRRKTPAPTFPESTESACAEVRAALVALITLLLPEGQPVYLRTRYGWQMFPLYQINRLLAPEGLVIQASKTRQAERLVACIDKDGQIERYGLFVLRRPEEDEA